MTPSSFFGTSLRRDPNQPADLNARIEAQLRERLEDAVDFVCLEALVKRRQALSRPAPAADNTRDREEFTQSVHTFLAELWSAIASVGCSAARIAVGLPMGTSRRARTAGSSVPSGLAV